MKTEKNQGSISNRTFFDTENDNFKVDDSLTEQSDDIDETTAEAEEELIEVPIKTEDDIEMGEEIEEDEDDEEHFEEGDNEELGDDTEFSYSPFVGSLLDAGILDVENIEEYEDSEEGFQNMVSDTVDRKLESRISAMSPEAQRLFELEANGGNIRDLLALEAVDYSQIDLEDADNQKLLITEKLEIEGYSEEEIAERLQDLEDLQKLDKEAKIAHRYLAKKNEADKEALVIKAKEAQDIQIAKAEEDAAAFKKQVLSTTKIAGIPVTKKDVERLYNYIATPAAKDKSGKVLTKYEQENTVENRLKQAYFQMMNYDFSSIEKKATSKANLNIKKNLAHFQDSNTKSATKERPREIKQNTKIPNMWAGDTNNTL